MGGRWTPKGLATVYASLDTSTAVLEVAVHKDFDALDCKPHRLTQARALDRSRIHVVQRDSIGNC
ncbi:RES domain-containing protein [Pseudomonas sp. GL-B-12]|uniref:RES domain-containing protein n=1 Tax=Pseudomonas sp. GL-B-12 TaxID=2832374 RepID=UPI001CBE298C|nr:RES domain-containing protein [Pseudomonas sp. GL-B-12]